MVQTLVSTRVSFLFNHFLIIDRNALTYPFKLLLIIIMKMKRRLHPIVTKNKEMRLVTFISTGVFIVLSSFIIKQNAVSKHSIYEKKWTLSKMRIGDELKEVVSSNAYIYFDQNKKQVNGNAGCNNYGSSFTINNKDIHFTQSFSTRMYCEGVQALENTYIELLPKTTTFELKENRLKLFEKKMLILEYTFQK